MTLATKCGSMLYLITILFIPVFGSTHPNILLMVGDDIGWNDLQYNNPNMKTPILDSLAKGGIKFTDYHVFKVCSPTRATFMTGRIPFHHGVQGVLHDGDALPTNYTWLPKVLGEAGYATHMVGKHHMGFFDQKYLPTWRGFDSYFGYLEGSENYWSHNSTRKDCPGRDLVNCTADPNKPFTKACVPVNDYEQVYSTFMFNAEMIRIIKQHDKSKPLFLLASYQNAHTPVTCPKSYEAQFPNSTRPQYAGDILAMDEAVGNLTDALKEVGLFDNTILIWTTDNGGNWRGQGNNWPLRGAKFSLWEGGTRGVALMYSELLPKSARGIVNNGLMHAADWYNTLLSAANIPIPNNSTAIDSINMWPMLINPGTPSPRKILIHNVVNKLNKPLSGKIRVGPYNLYVGDPGDYSGWVRPGEDWKNHTGSFCVDSPCLFDVVADMTEHKDIAKKHPDIVANLSALLKASRCPECMADEVPKTKNTACTTLYSFGSIGPYV